MSDREYAIEFVRGRATRISEMAISTFIVFAAGLPVAHVTQNPELGAIAGIAVLVMVNEVLWRHRGYPELAPVGSLIARLRDRFRE